MNARSLGWMVVYTLAGLAVILMLVTLHQIGTVTQATRDAQRDRVPLLEQTNRAARTAKGTADAIHSCVTPGEPCFERAQRQTAGAVSSINDVAIYAAACARVTPEPTVTAIRKCVMAQLHAREQHKN